MLRNILTFGLMAALLVGCSDDANDDAGTAAGGTAGKTGTTETSGTGGTAATGGDAPMAPMLTDASADTKALWSDIEGYADWTKFSDNPELRQSATHSNMFVVSYHNDVVETAMADGTLPLPDGSIIVKENWMAKDDPGPMALTVMSKMGKDWYWVQGTPDGQVFVGPDGDPMEGKDVGMCVMCHGAAKDNDFVLTQKL